MSRVVVSNVQVLTAGTRYDQEHATKDGKPIPTTVVTLLVTPEDAETDGARVSEGKIMLTLRNPLDTAPTEDQGRAHGALLGEASLPPVRRWCEGPAAWPRPRRAGARAAPKIYTVETIRAAKRSEEVSPLMTTLSRLPGLCAIALVVTHVDRSRLRPGRPAGAASRRRQRPLPRRSLPSTTRRSRLRPAAPR